MMLEKITHVAIRMPSGLVLSMPKPNRHIDIVKQAESFRAGCLIIKTPLAAGEQGFLTNIGRFINRSDGLIVARKARQILDNEWRHESQLCSEMVW